MVGFILADTVGIFGFTLPVVTGWAYEALAAELVSAAVLAVLVVRSWLAFTGGAGTGAGAGASGGRDADHGSVEVTTPH